MALVTTIGDATANSYVTLADVATYLTSHFTSPAVVAKWDALANAQKEALLIRATQLLDRHVKWQGEVVDDVQALSWPRAWAYDRYDRQIDSSVIPTFLKEFQIETALWIMEQAGVIPQIGNAEFDAIRVGSLEINFNEAGGTRRSMLPEEVLAALAPMGQYAAQTAGSTRSVGLVRS